MIDQPRASLVDAFDPPSGQVGVSAIFVTMTADTRVLNEALAVFTGASGRAREADGRCIAYLLRDPGRRDPGSAGIRPDEVPGLFEMTPRGTVDGRLLHAKLALLGFADAADVAPKHLRLVVSTGNFTTDSVKQRLELLFVTESPVGRAGDKEALTDIAMAAAFIEDLAAERFQLPRKAEGHRETPLGAWDTLLRVARNHPGKGTKARFIHSLKEPLLGQIGKRFAAAGGPPRNFLLCGSGFFEQSIVDDGASVLAALADLPGLSPRAERMVLVDPPQAAQVHGARDALARIGFRGLYRATDSTRTGRRLHAKFVIAGTQEDRREGLRIARSVMYLGSGNLTLRGLKLGPDSGGNVECGVVFHPDAKIPEEVLRDHLFFDRNSPFVGEVSGVPEAEPEALASEPTICPVLFVNATQDGRLAIEWTAEAQGTVELVFADDHVVLVRAGEPSVELPVGFEGQGSLVVRWRDASQHEHQIPVISPDGLYAWRPVAIRRFEDLLQALRTPSYRALVEDADDEPEEEASERPTKGPNPDHPPGVERRYPMMELAQLVEAWGRRVQAVEPHGVRAALYELELLAATPVPEGIRQAWRGMPVSLREHLLSGALAPEPMTPDLEERYRRAVDLLIERWGLRCP